MQIRQYTWDVIDSNSWLITEDNHGLLVDAVINPELYSVVRSLETLTVILTHSHFDHICGLNDIRGLKPDTEVIATALCSEHIGNPYRNMSSAADAFLVFYKGGVSGKKHIEPFVCAPANQVTDDDFSFSWEKHLVELKGFHGHTEDGIIIQIDHDIMFSGDTILSIPTITRFPGGSTKRFREEDLPALRKMEDQCVCPGHGQPDMLSNMMKQYNL